MQITAAVRRKHVKSIVGEKKPLVLSRGSPPKARAGSGSQPEAEAASERPEGGVLL